MQIIAVNISEELSVNDFEELLSYVPLEKQKKIKSFLHFKDAKRTLVGEILVRSILGKQLSLKNKDINIYYNAYGKPYIKIEGNYFNLSHSGDWVVCAFDSSPVGIDVEIIKLIDLSLVLSFFSTEEAEYVFSIKSQNEQINRFYDLWTLKESYIKAIGRGLSIPLESFSIDLRNYLEIIKMKSVLDNRYYYLKKLFIDENHKLSICTMHPQISNEIIFKKIKEIISLMKENA
ncbi:4'-phosphopantetheinyl transferase superfamily protein [Bacillus cereus]|nr:4'-phosphopantetheinyl transferase superfamily protein [Bacillus cereus]